MILVISRGFSLRNEDDAREIRGTSADRSARRRLEESQNSMEASRTSGGFGNVNSMRNVFQRALKFHPAIIAVTFDTRNARENGIQVRKEEPD